MRFKRNQLLNLVLVIYVVTCTLIQIYNLGSNKFGLYFSSEISKIISTIAPTAEITNDIQSSLLILSISWVMVLFSTILLIFISNIDQSKYKKILSQSSFLFESIIIASSIFLPYFISQRPIGNFGMYASFLRYMLSNFSWFVIVYGAGIWLAFSAGFFCCYISIKLLLFKNLS